MVNMAQVSILVTVNTGLAQVSLLATADMDLAQVSPLAMDDMVLLLDSHQTAANRDLT